MSWTKTTSFRSPAFFSLSMSEKRSMKLGWNDVVEASRGRRDELLETAPQPHHQHEVDPEGAQADPPIRSSRARVAVPMVGDCSRDRRGWSVAYDPGSTEGIEHREMQPVSLFALKCSA